MKALLNRHPDVQAAITRQQNRNLVKAPVWIDSKGREHEINEMDTSHLFFCLTMMWNNTMPIKTRENFKPYHFTADRFINKAYLVSVITAIWQELNRRDDLFPHQQGELYVMLDYWSHLDQIKELTWT